MRNGRLRRLVGGLGLGYLHTTVVVVVGLWLTPFLLGHLGEKHYGLWLLAAQAVFYLGLLDVGIVALVPRDLAMAAGRAHGGEVGPLRAITGRALHLACWQAAFVAAAGALLAVLLPAEWTPLRGPLAALTVAFTLVFPCRVFPAALQGLQDLPRLGAIQIVGWTLGSVATVVGIYAGLGLYSLAIAWAVNQVFVAAATWQRLVRAFPGVIPSRLPRLSPREIRLHFGRGGWLSLDQIAQVLLAGTDLVVIGHLLGPEAVVPYACTGRLVLLLARQPQMLMQMALPALSQLRTSSTRERLVEVSGAMSLVMLLGTGAVAVVVLAVNESFVGWWVGGARFGGTTLTALLLASMVMRHVNLTLVYRLYCLGHDRRNAVTLVADGLCGTATMLALVPLLGAQGAALGMLAGTCLVSIPSNLVALGHEGGSSVRDLAAPLRPWLFRFVPLVVVVGALSGSLRVQGVAGLALLTAGVLLTYAVVMMPVLWSPFLRDLFLPGIESMLGAPGFMRWPLQVIRGVVR